MCDYSIHVASRPAQVGDRLETKNFGTGTIGFCGGGGLAICLLPGTEVAFDELARLHPDLGLETFDNVAIFCQVDKDNPFRHHDCLEFPDGRVALLASSRRLPVGDCAAIAGGAAERCGARGTAAGRIRRIRRLNCPQKALRCPNSA